MSTHPSLSLPAGVLPASETRRRRNQRVGVRVWLWFVALLILLIVVVGGATRLTESGLSITEWKPISGVIPPLTQQAWQAEFDKYKTIPQFSQLNPDMDLQGFKSIFYWEWGHRLLARLIGFAVAFPLAFFWLTGALSRGMKLRLTGLLALGGLQGLIGWWMVKSGLVDRVEVSQYRLALHLLVASATLALSVWFAEGLKNRLPPRLGHSEPRIRLGASLLVLGVFLQLGLGALVAGLRAGRIYNTWPLMGDHAVPPADELFVKTPLWRNLFENATTAQFDHRVMAYLLLILAVAHAVDCWRTAPHSAAARSAMLLAVLVACQAVIGVTTLLLVVPLGAALAHQTFAMIVLAAAIVHRSGLRQARTAARMGVAPRTQART